jgi:hypothetical protein
MVTVQSIAQSILQGQRKMSGLRVTYCGYFDQPRYLSEAEHSFCGPLTILVEA